MTVINTNIASINAQFNLSKVNKQMESAMEQLSSGKRINSAADDAAGLSIATRMESQIRGLQQTVKNANDGISLVASVEGALQESTDILQRMYELSIQASNSTYNDSDRAALQDEVSQLQTELDRIASDTEFNGQKIVDGSFTGKSLNVGFTASGMIDINIGDHSSAGLSAVGTVDALATLKSSVSNVALGLDTQAGTSSTSQIAVVKADTQAASISQSQYNIGQDSTQAISTVTTTNNASTGGAVTETFTTMEAGAVAKTASGTGVAVDGHGGTQSLAVSVTGDTTTIQEETITLGGTGLKVGAIFGAEDATGNESNYTIRAEDIQSTTALTLAAIATNWAAQITDDGELGDYGTATASGAVITMVHGSAAAVITTAIVDSTTVAPTAAAVDVAVLTFTGDYDEGDVITLFGNSAAGAKDESVSYTVSATDAALATTQLRADAVVAGVAALLNGSTTTFEGLTANTVSVVGAGSSGSATGPHVLTVTGTKGATDFRVEINTADGRTAVDAAGTQDTDIAYIDTATSAAGLDGIVDMKGFSLSGEVKSGDIIAFQANGTNITYTVDSDDLVTDSTQTKSNAIDSFIEVFNAADTTDRSDATGGVLTASREGDSTVVFTASVASATDLAGTFAVTNRTNATTTIAASTDAPADGAVAATSTSTIPTTGLAEGDVMNMTFDNTLGTAVQYTVTRDDIGSDADATLANVRANMIVAFNNSDTVDRTSTTSGLTTASTGDDAGDIVFTGTDTTDTLTLGVTVAATNGTQTVANGKLLVGTEISRATDSTGTATGSYEENNAVATASTKVIKFDADGIGVTGDNMEVGDTVSMTVAGTTVSHVVETNKNTAEYIAAALADLVNDTDGQGSTISTAAAGIITATAENGVLTLTSAEEGAASDFSVSVSTSNDAAEAQVSAVKMDAAQDLEVGDQVVLTIDAGQNKISISVTQEMVDLGAAGAREAARDALVALTGDLENITLTADASDTDKLILTSEVPGVAFTAVMSETAYSAVRQQDLIEISGTIGRGDVFTVTANGSTNTTTYAVTEEVAALRTNEERITAVRDALIDKIETDSTILGLISGVVASGDNGFVMTALTAGTAIDSSTVATTNNTSIASQAQVDNVALSGDAEEGDVFSISLDNGTSVSYTVTADDAAGGTTGDRLNAARDGLIAAAASGLSGVTASASDDDGTLILTSTQVGIGFETSVSTSNGSDVAQVEAVAFANVEAGDTFTVSIGGESASYTAQAGDDGAAVAAWMEQNGSFAGKSLSVADGQLSVQGAAGESFAVTIATSNQAGGVQSDEFALSGTVETNDVYSVDIDGTSVSYSVQDTDLTMDTVVANLAAAINSSSAAATVTASVNDDGNLALASTTAGTGYTASVEVSDVGRSRNSVASIDISTEDGANSAAAVIQGAISQVNETRSELGAIENRLDHTISNLGSVIVNTEASQSRIEDADFASVTGQLTKAQIMSQAATAMLAQANASKQGVLSLLQG